MTTFTVTLNDPSNQYSAYHANVSAGILAAANMWGAQIQGQGSIAIQVNFSNLGGSTLASAGSTTFPFAGTVNGVNIYEHGALYEIQTGIDPNGSTSDITVNVSTAYLTAGDFFFDPTRTQTVPSNKTDFMSVMLHELGHALIFNGFLNDSGKMPTDTDGKPYGTTYDTHIFVSNGQAYFGGPNVSIVNGGPVLLSSLSNTAHLGVTDLMYPSIADGAKIFISDLDIAIAQDSGAPIATDRADYIILVQGNDFFNAGAGNDTVIGGAGNDSLAGGAGADQLVGGLGNDVLLGNQDNDVVLGNQGADIIVGGQGNDILVGGQDADLILGNEANDTIYGNEANDTIFGGAGDDLIIAGQGNDTVYGNEGNDSMFGNEGADRFIFGSGSGTDTIMDFSFASGDILDLQGQSYTTGTGAGGAVLLSLSGGGTILLSGVATFQAGFIA